MENKMSWIIWVITVMIVFICIAVVAIFYNLTKLQEETREKYLEVDGCRMGKWSMVKQLLGYVESYHEEGRTFEKAHAVLDRDFLLTGKEERSFLYRQMEEILAALIVEVKEHGNLQCEEKIRNLCIKLNNEAGRYHTAEAQYNQCVSIYNAQIEKIPDKYVAAVFGLKKQPRL